MNHSIIWHEQKLANDRLYWKAIRERAIAWLDQYNEAESKLFRYEITIEGAKRLGMTEFNQETFNVETGVKVAGGEQ